MLRHGGQYKVTIKSPGFMVRAELFKVESDIAKTVTQPVGSFGSPIVIADERTRPEHLPLTIEIPRQRVELSPLPS